MFYQILQKLVRQFFLSKGRAPRSAMEWQQLKSRARELVSEQGGIPSITSKTTIDDLMTGPHISDGPKGQRMWDFSKDLPTRDVQSQTADVIPFPKGITASKKVKAMMKSGDVKLGEAPKTLPGTLKSKKDRHILMRDAHEDIARMRRENKSAVERFNQKYGKNEPKTVEDFRDKGDWDPSGMAGGGIAPLVGEPSYAADFYDDRTPMAGGGALKKFIEALFIKASNAIRRGEGKWKGLDQKQRIVQHDNLTKKVTEYQKTGKTEGLEEYFDVNPEYQGLSPEEAFAAVETKVKKPKVIDERTMIKQKYPDITDDLVEKILVDDNPQRKAEVLATMDQFLKLKEVGKGSEEAFQIVTESIKNPIKHAEGGRADFIFGGSAGLKALWRSILKNVSKGQGKKIDKFFPKMSTQEKELTKLGEKFDPTAFKAFSERESALKLEGIEHIIDRLKLDKKILKQQASNKAMKDEGLDFLMKHMENTEMFPPHLKKYTDIDKDVLNMETIKKNLIMKDRKLNAYGGRIEYAGGGLAGLPPITQGLPQGPGIQQPPMAAGPQPAGIPGGTIVAQNQMQQNPWMGSQMQQGIGGMPQRGQPRPGGMPRPMAAEGGRMGFGLGGMGRRAFLKLMGAGAATAGAAKSGLFGMLKAGKPITGALTSVPIKDISGMPAWFKPLVNRVIKDGNDVSKTHASKDMELVHKSVLPDSNTDVLVTQSLDTGDVVVDIGLTKHGFADGKFGQPVRLEYKAGEWIEPSISKTGKKSQGMKTKEEFWIEEAEFTGGHPENIKFEEFSSNKFGKHESDFSEVEAFAKGKRKKVRLKQFDSSQKEAEDLADHFSNYPKPDDYATGGVARMLGE
jgi:hypothetical protein